MNILIASSEVVPFAKTGGLADVCGAIPQELQQLGHNVSVFMPFYQCVESSDFDFQTLDAEFEIPVGDQVEIGSLLTTNLPGTDVPIYFVRHDDYFRREGIYGEGGHDYPDNCQRFTFFCRAVLESIRLLDLNTDLIHANDWQTGLLPALLETEHRSNPLYESIATLMTIHNLAYQGCFDASAMAITGMDWKYFNWQQSEFHGQLNLLKTGIVFSDAINAVSPTYAEEIQSPEQGCGLDPVLRTRADRLSGIINGIDPGEWNPKTDPHIAANFSVENWRQGKSVCKEALQKEMMLEPNPNRPLIGIIGRLAAQKGWSLILPMLRAWLQDPDNDTQWVILGTGDPDYHAVLASLHQSHANKLAVTLGFSNDLAHRIEAGSDMFLMPSEYEPCGLNQMYSMAYGTVPVAHRTGGLADTIVDASLQTLHEGTTNGFLFDDFSAGALSETTHRAVRMYRHDQNSWDQLVRTGMQRDWSWASSVREYEALYQETVAQRASSNPVS